MGGGAGSSSLATTQRTSPHPPSHFCGGLLLLSTLTKIDRDGFAAMRRPERRSGHAGEPDPPGRGWDDTQCSTGYNRAGSFPRRFPPIPHTPSAGSLFVLFAPLRKNRCGVRGVSSCGPPMLVPSGRSGPPIGVRHRNFFAAKCVLARPTTTSDSLEWFGGRGAFCLLPETLPFKGASRSERRYTEPMTARPPINVPSDDWYVTRGF